MDEPTETPTIRQGPQMTEAQSQEYFRLLVELVGNHGQASAAVNAELQRIAADPALAIPGNLIGIIKVLCDCKAIIVILECLCKWLTGGKA